MHQKQLSPEVLLIGNPEYIRISLIWYVLRNRTLPCNYDIDLPSFLVSTNHYFMPFDPFYVLCFDFILF